MRDKPIIGIAGELITVKEVPVVGFDYEYTRNNYARAIIINGGIPCYLPVTEDETVIREYVNMIDGLLIPGGLDVNPIFYEEEPKPLLEVTIPRTDRFQISMIHEILRCDKPLFGSCRGCQVLNVALGGTLYQDISYGVKEPIQHFQFTQLDRVAHSIDIKEGSIIYDIYGSKILVNSYHHQSIKRVGDGLKVTAISPDGVVESVQFMDRGFVIGVQWHPEMLLEGEDNMNPLFKEFILAASERKKLCR